MSELKYTDDAARKLEAMYRTRDVAAQRSEALKQLQLSEGEQVIDIGCGPGFLCEEITRFVGPSGRVLGLDISDDFVARAEQRKKGPSPEYRMADATDIDEPDETFDVAACTQVAEYVPDVDKALSETYRVLKANGRAVFVATDWDSVIWHSDAPDRMSRVMTCWEAHCAHPRLPRSLPKRLRNAGFNVTAASVFPILNLKWGDDTYSKGLSDLIRGFVAGRAEVSPDDLAAWQDELSRLGQDARYFFSISRYIFRTSKPG